jgi:hypothetical protein
MKQDKTLTISNNKEVANNPSLINNDKTLTMSNNKEVVNNPSLINNDKTILPSSILQDENSIELNLERSRYDINHIRLLFNLVEKKDWIAIREVTINSTNEECNPIDINSLHLIVNRAFVILSSLILQGYDNKLLDDAESLCNNAENIFLNADKENFGIDKINSFVVFGITTYICYLVSSYNHALKYSCIDKCREFIEIYNCIKSKSLSFCKDDSDVLVLSSQWYDEGTLYINSIENTTELPDLKPIITDNALNEWEKSKINIKNKMNDPSKESPSIAMDTLMKFTGLESIKKQFLSDFHRINLSKEQGISFDSCNYNTRCDGNPGRNSYLFISHIYFIQFNYL